MNYGFSGLNQNLTPNKNNNFTVSTALNAKELISAVRVKSIVLNESHLKFKDLGGWNALGAIEYELVEFPDTYGVAYPSNPNNKNYPLINEIVYIISLPTTDIGKTNVSQKSYYINSVALWNHPHHNAYPLNSNTSSPPQTKSYLQTQAGSPSIVSNNPTQTFLGKTFKERPDIHPLLPFEGDVIQEGRWGNSISLSSTVMASASLSPNDWSTEGIGQDGDPIVIIRNGQPSEKDQPENISGSGWIPIIEDINKDGSSIYLTSTQQIPLNASSTSYVSYKNNPPDSPDKYSGKQIILNSGRLVFNSYEDHLLLSSVKSINLNSQESVNIDTKKFVTQADKIFLGKEELATEPLLLGNTTVMLLRDLIYSVKELTLLLQNLTSDPVIPYQPATFQTTLQTQTVGIMTCLNSLENQLGYSQESCTITSKRNFTL